MDEYERKVQIHKQIEEMDKETLLKAVWEYTGDILLEDEDFLEYLIEMQYVECEE